MYCWWGVPTIISTLQSGPQHASPDTFSVSLYLLPTTICSPVTKHLQSQLAERNDNMENIIGLEKNWNSEKMCGGEVLVWQADTCANSYLTYKKKQCTSHPKTSAGLLMPRLTIKTQTKSNQSLVLSVCKINTISFSYPSDSIPLFQLCGGDSTKGIVVKCVMKW